MIRAASRIIARRLLAALDHPAGLAVAALIVIYLDLLVTK